MSIVLNTIVDTSIAMLSKIQYNLPTRSHLGNTWSHSARLNANHRWTSRQVRCGLLQASLWLEAISAGNSIFHNTKFDTYDDIPKIHLPNWHLYFPFRAAYNARQRLQEYVLSAIVGAGKPLVSMFVVVRIGPAMYDLADISSDAAGNIT